MRLPMYKAVDRSTLQTGWDKRHNVALDQPQGPEVAIVTLLLGLETYIVSHKARYDSDVWDDGVLAYGVVDIVKGIRTLLNGETGRLDCGTIDGRMCELLKLCGELV